MSGNPQMSRPLFSVVMPTYNRAGLIKITLEHILQQSCRSFEVVIVDDGSADNTSDVVGAINDPRIRYIKQANAGPVMARANGCDHALGEWIAFCDSDDIWDGHYLERLQSVIEKHGPEIIFTDYMVEGESVSRIAGSGKNRLFQRRCAGTECALQPSELYPQLMKYQPIMISAFAISMNLYKSIGGIDRNLRVIGSEDAHLTQRACATGMTVYIDEPLVVLGRGGDNLSANYIRNLDGGMQILEDFVCRQLIPQELSGCTLAAISSHALEIAKQYYWQRDLKKSRTYLKRYRLWKKPEGLILLIKTIVRAFV